MVVSHSAVSTLSLTLQAVLLITVQALHLRELSIIVACIKYVKDLCCIGGVVVAHPLHCKDITSLLNFKICGLILLRFLCKSLIFSVKKILPRDCVCLAFTSFVVRQAPSDQPEGLYYARVLYSAHGRACASSVQYPPCTFKVVKAV